MEAKTNGPTSIDEYIAQFPQDIQKTLNEVRAVIRESAPGAKEVISYQMPAFRKHGVLVYFAARTDYIGFYPTGSGIEAFKTELAGYQISKGSAHFPLSRPMPVDLIRKIVKFRVAEDEQKASLKKKR